MIGQRQRGSSLVPVLMLMELFWLQWTSISSINHFHKIFGMNPALWKESVFHVFIQGLAKYNNSKFFKDVSQDIQKEDVTYELLSFFSWHPRASSVQRGRLVINMSLVPSQDKALLALNPSALMKKKTYCTHRETGTFSNTKTFTHTYTNLYFDNKLSKWKWPLWSSFTGQMAAISTTQCGLRGCIGALPLFHVCFTLILCPCSLLQENKVKTQKIWLFFIILKQHYSCCSDSVYMLGHISILISQLLMFNSNSNLHLILRNSFALPLLYNGKGKCSLECSSSPCGLTTKDLD